MKQVSQLDQDGYFVGMTVADQSPLEEGVYLIPAGAVESDAPSIPDGQRAKWENEQWGFEAIPLPEPELEEEIQYNETVRTQRQYAYQREADPLFFKTQRGEATLEQWQAKIDEVRKRFPYAED